jgi:hypothetical protein
VDTYFKWVGASITQLADSEYSTKTCRYRSHPNLDSFRVDDKPGTIFSSFRRGGIDY